MIFVFEYVNVTAEKIIMNSNETLRYAKGFGHKNTILNMAKQIVIKYRDNILFTSKNILFLDTLYILSFYF